MNIDSIKKKIKVNVPIIKIDQSGIYIIGIKIKSYDKKIKEKT